MEIPGDELIKIIGQQTVKIIILESEIARMGQALKESKPSIESESTPKIHS